MRILLLATMILVANWAKANETSLFECRKIKDIEERVACYDAIVDTLFPVAATSDPDTDEAETVEQSNPAPTGHSLFGKSDAESKRIVEETLAIEQVSELRAVVTSVGKNAYKKLTITLDNGQIWRQLDNDPLPLRKGETVVIRSAKLGSFLLEKASGSGSIRVNRLN